MLNKKREPDAITQRKGYTCVFPENEQSPRWFLIGCIQPGNLETTRQMKHLKVDNTSIKRRCPKRENKPMSQGEITDPKMILSCLMTVLHVNSCQCRIQIPLVRGDRRHTCDRRHVICSC